jgi:hypothetical protein
VGDLLYANTTTTVAKLADVAVGNALVSGGVGSAPSYGKIGLATHVSGTLPVLNGGTGATDAAGIRTAAGATTVGGNVFTLTNPSAITFPRFNADNTVSALDAATFRTAIGAGTGAGTVTGVTGTAPVVSSGGTAPAISMAAASSGVNGYMTGVYATKLDGIAAGATANTGTVTSVSGTGTVSGLTLTGTVTGSGSLTLGGSIGTLNQNTTGSAGAVNGLTKIQMWNNSGQDHSTYQSFDAIPNFGVWYMQNSAAADVPQASSQWYANTVGLGNNYAYSEYSLMTAVSRNLGTKYTWYRTRDAGAWGAWVKGAAGFADTSGACTGNAATATALATGRTIAITGDLTYTSPSFNGSANITAAGTLAASGVTAGSYTYASITVDAKGRLTAASNGASPSAFPAGTVMLFVQTAAPTGWTKITTSDNAALRMVSGTASTGGTANFTTAFSSRTPAGTVSTTGTVTTTGTVGGTTLSTTTMPSHQHQGFSNLNLQYSGGGGRPNDAPNGYATAGRSWYTLFAGGSGAHDHSFTGGSGSISASSSFTGTAMDFEVKYVDVIQASKD